MNLVAIRLRDLVVVTDLLEERLPGQGTRVMREALAMVGPPPGDMESLRLFLRGPIYAVLGEIVGEDEGFGLVLWLESRVSAALLARAEARPPAAPDRRSTAPARTSMTDQVLVALVAKGYVLEERLIASVGDIACVLPVRLPHEAQTVIDRHGPLLVIVDAAHPIDHPEGLCELITACAPSVTTVVWAADAPWGRAITGLLAEEMPSGVVLLAEHEGVGPLADLVRARQASAA